MFRYQSVLIDRGEIIVDKKCPYCNEEMESGYIQCRDGLWWAKKKRLVAAFPNLDKMSVKLSIEDGPFSGCAARAYLCRTCKKIIVDCHRN